MTRRTTSRKESGFGTVARAVSPKRLPIDAVELVLAAISVYICLVLWYTVDGTISYASTEKRGRNNRGMLCRINRLVSASSTTMSGIDNALCVH